MKIKTSELTGAALDWAVEQIESGAGPDKAQKQWRYFGRVFHPSTDWAQGGPIIEREKMQTKFCGDYLGWGAIKDGYVAGCFGPTLLIAGMRCHVTLEMGDEIDVPEELL